MTPYKLGQIAAWSHPAKGKAWGTIILIHGMGEHSARHMNTIRVLNDHGYTVLRFDLRGSGESDGKRQWIESFNDYLDDVDAAMECAKQNGCPAPYFLMGHSMGGTIAAHSIAVRGARSYSGLILSSPAFHLGGGVSPLKMWIGRRIEKILPGLSIPAALDAGTISRDPAVVAAYGKDPLNCGANTVKQGNEVIRAIEKLPEIVKKISLPVFISHGTADKLILSSGSQELFDKIASKDKTLELFNGGYHELHNDLDKDKYFEKLLHWLDRHSHT